MRIKIAWFGLAFASILMLSRSGHSTIVGGGGGGQSLTYEESLAAIIATEPIPADELPPVGMFYLASEGSNAAPLPGSLGLAAWDLGDGNFLINDLDGITLSSASASTSLRLSSQSGMSLMMNALDEPPSPGTGTNGGDTNLFSYTYDTNQLWIDLTHISSDGVVSGRLHHATNYTYAIVASTSLDGNNWTVEAQVFPGSNTNLAPYSLNTQNRTNLFIRAFDWAGVTHSGNTVPDWWLYFYFGTNGLTALTDSSTDSQGNTLVYDYQNNQDPNVISFYLSATNNRFSSSTAPVELDITAGTPNYYAVSIDDVNYFSNASWQTYTGSNVSVGPMSEGWHNVWIGLRGLPANATPTWKGMRVKVDTTAPVLYVTNSIPDDIPVIQILGYSTKALSSLTYDIVNSDGALSNQPVAIVVQIYDTNNWEMTTSAFQAYDVELAAGGNTITLHAIDWAGHAASTQVEVTFDNSSKSAPSVIVLWPTNGMALCGSTFHCYGTVDDPTATVYVQQMMSDGTSSNVSGLVGRDGRFWVRNMTLDGTTNLVVTVTDAADNVVTTEVPVTQSTQLLSIDPVHPVQPGDTNVTVSASADAAVFVNGVAAAYDSTCQYWTAPIIPTGVAGGAILVKSGNTGFATIVDPASGIYMSSYQSNYYLTVSYYTNGYFIASTNHWDDKRGGASCGLEASCNWMWTIDWPTSSWPQTPPDGAMTSYSIPTGNQYGQGSAGWGNYFDSSMVCKDVDYTFPGSDCNWHCKEYVEKHHNLATGGLIGSTQKNLWCISVSAQAFNSVDDYNYYKTYGVGGENIPSQNIKIGNLGNLDANGQLWVVLSDNANLDFTPVAVGSSFYTITSIQTNKYTPTINLTTSTTNANLSTCVPEVCVGQQVTFTLNGLPTSSISNMVGSWHLPGNYVNYCYTPILMPEVPSGTVSDSYYNVSSMLDDTNRTSCWFINGNGGTVTVGLNLQLLSGQYVTVGAKGSFRVFRPTMDHFSITSPGTIQCDDSTSCIELSGIAFEAHVVSSDFAGKLNWTQLINRSYVSINPVDYIILSTYGSFWLDCREFYNIDTTTSGDYDQDAPPKHKIIDKGGVADVQLEDNPAVGERLGVTSITDQFKSYLVFNPDTTDGNNIWVTLGRVDWGWHASVGVSAFGINGAAIIPGSISNTPPTFTNTDEFPVWGSVYHNK